MRREFATTLLLSTLVSFLVPELISVGEAVWLNIPKTGTKCVSEEIQSKVVVLADYLVISDEHSIFPTVSVKVTSPYGSVLHHSENATHGQFAFTTQESGTYLACFEAVGNSHGNNDISINLDWKTGIAAKDWDSIARKEKIEGVELELRKLEAAVEAIHENLLYLRNRNDDTLIRSETRDNEIHRRRRIEDDAEAQTTTSQVEDDAEAQTTMDRRRCGGADNDGRPTGSNKAKRKLQSEEQFKQMMEQNDKLIKAITKDISSITDPASRAYIENERKIILKKRAQTNQSEEHGEGSQYQYQGSQYRASQAQGEDQISPNDPENFTPYYNYLSGANNNLVRNKKRRYREKSSGSERVSSHSKRHKPSPDARSSMSCASPWDLGAASPSPIRPLVPPAVEEPINLRIYGKELREGILLGSCMDGGMMMILTRGTQIVRPLIPMKLTLAKCYLLSVRNSLGLKQRLLNGKTVSFSVPELLEAHNCKLGSVEKKKKKKKKERVVLLVHDPKLPPFLDNGRAVFTKQVEPVKDPTSDMAIV
ncbi:unnamed protein product [Brassica oleracea]